MMPIDPAVKKPNEYSDYICAAVVRAWQQELLAFNCGVTP
jgi:hypothetical protein